MKKKFIILAAFAIFSAGAYCDMYFMWGVDNGYTNMAGNSGWYFGTFLGAQYYPFDGPIGVGLDLKLRFPLINYKDYKYEYRYRNSLHNINEIRTAKSDIASIGIDFVVAPTLSLRLFYKEHKRNFHPVLKLYPVFAYSKHNEFSFLKLLDKSNSFKTISEPYIGGGIEICFNWTKAVEYPRGGGEVFLMYNQGTLLDTKEKYFSIGLGIRGFLRSSIRDKRAVEKIRLEQERMQREYAAQKEQERIRLAQERAEAETAAIKSGSLPKMIDFINQYGDSENIRLAIEQFLSGNKNQSYKELKYFENPYSFEKGSVYYCSSLSVYQWISEYSFLAKVDGEIIYVETSNIENVKNRISYAFLKANGVMEYSSAMSSLKIVPRFTLMLFNGGKVEYN